METTRKQTAVEWFVDLFKDEPRFLNEFSLDIKQAKEMEKQQIIEAVEETMQEMNLYESFRTLKNGEQYYNETFKNK
jgi:hypothetical protein